MEQRSGHPIEQVGRALRARMSWLKPKTEGAEKAA
jgi:hypothetical protein